MNDPLLFETRAAFRSWLQEHCLSNQGVWLLFGKPGGPATLKANDALEEALCFGWIDGQMKRVDELSYIKYFKQRNIKSKWSEKNKKLVEKLEANGQMTNFGQAKITTARENGCWNMPKAEGLTPEQLQDFVKLITPYDEAYKNYGNMTPSVQRTYAKSYYFGAKTEEGKKSNLKRIIQRLTLNLNPMESLKKQLNGKE